MAKHRHLSEQETAFLIENSDNEHPVHLSFGIGWVGMERSPANQWALDLLDQRAASLAFEHR